MSHDRRNVITLDSLPSYLLKEKKEYSDPYKTKSVPVKLKPINSTHSRP
jgi:hypothetical protein